MMIGDWLDIGPVTQIEPGTARTLPVKGGEEIAVFHTMRGEFFAIVNVCPHKQGPLSQGIVHGDVVACPLHNWQINLDTGEAVAPDVGCAHRHEARIENGRVLLSLNSATECA